VLPRLYAPPNKGDGDILDGLGIEMRRAGMVDLLAAHRPVLERCWRYWNSLHGLGPERAGRMYGGGRVAPGGGNTLVPQEVWHLDDDGIAAQVGAPPPALAAPPSPPPTPPPSAPRSSRRRTASTSTRCC